MKKLSIILACALVAMMSCTKSKEVHPEIGDGNDEIVTVGAKDVHVEYTRTDHTELNRVVFHYRPAETLQFEAAEMTKRETFFELTLNDLLKDTLYCYYYELFPNSGSAYNTEQKIFHTQAFEALMAELPTVVTLEIYDITANSAVCRGEVTLDGHAEVTERGICWSINENPTINDSQIAAGSGVGAFTAMVNGLESNTTYHVRAYAINEVGTAYGLDREFVTDFTEGALSGNFSVSETQKVRFSKGNLQFQASTNTWRFAEHQWDFVGNETYGTVYENGEKCNNSLISSTYSGWIDLFSWGTSGYNHGAICYQPWSTSTSNSDYNAYGVSTCSLFDQTGHADWGYNTISNGGNQEGLWHTLTRDEINYIIHSRNTLSGMRFAKATVNDVQGIILFPDDWEASVYEIVDNDIENASCSSNIIESSIWVDVFETNGAVFMPVTGQRPGNSVTILEKGLYWLATSTAGGSAFNICFDNSSLISDDDCGDLDRYAGRAVRLVQDANP